MFESTVHDHFDWKVAENVIETGSEAPKATRRAL